MCSSDLDDRDVGMLSLMQSLHLMELRKMPSIFQGCDLKNISISLILKQPWAYGYHQGSQRALHNGLIYTMGKYIHDL